MFKYLLDLGNHEELFYTQLKTRGRAPFFLGPTQLDLRDPEQLALAVLRTLPKQLLYDLAANQPDTAPSS